MVFHMVDADAYGHAAELADDRGPGRACHPHGRQAQPAENKDRVQDDVHHGARHLADHLVYRLARYLQHTLHGHGHEQPEGEHGNDPHVVRAAREDLGVLCERSHKQAAARRAEHRKNSPAQHGDEDAVFRHFIGGFKVFFTQTAGQKRVDAHGGAHGHRDHQVLHRKG